MNLKVIAVIAVAALAAIFEPSLCKAAGQKPNIVLLVADDLGYGEPGCYGGKEIPTPNIDSLARNGIRFTQGYVTAPYCSPSRAALLTGRHQARFGYERNPIGAANDDPDTGLPLRELTLASHSSSLGYITGLVGKWHLGGTAKFHPLRRGFDEFFGFMHEGHYYMPHPWKDAHTWLRRSVLPGGGSGRYTTPGGRITYSSHMGHTEPSYNANNPLLRDSQPVEESSYLTEAFTRESVDFIRRHQAEPFFLYVAYNAVHSPMQATDHHVARFAHIPDVHRRIFAAMLSNLDDSVGAILKTLRDTGLEENTMVIFISDNGGATRELTSSNHPLRGEKGQLYEGGIRVPFLLQWKSRLPAGVVVDRPISTLDIFPTIDSIASSERRSAPVSTREPLDGIDLLPFLTGIHSELPDRSFHWRTQAALAMRHGDWKVIRPRRQAAFELYNLRNDPGETRNLATERPDLLQDLASRAISWDGKYDPSPGL